MGSQLKEDLWAFRRDQEAPGELPEGWKGWELLPEGWDSLGRQWCIHPEDRCSPPSYRDLLAV